MKRLSNVLAALVFASLVVFMSCGGGGDDPAPTAAALAAEKLNGTWALGSNDNVSYDSGPADGDWAAFKLIISNATESGMTYSTEGVPSEFTDIWSTTSGSIVFDSPEADAIIRDGLEFTSYIVTETTLSVTFTVPDPSTARVSGLYDAPWNFQLTKE